MRNSVRFFIFFGFVMLGVQPAHANLISDLDIISSSNIGSGNLGKVVLSQNGANEVDVQVILAKNTDFVSTGGPHNAFVFSLNLPSTAYSVAITSPSSGFTLAGVNPSNTPYGTFSYGIDCPGCGPGSSNAKPGPLDFTITGVTLADFVPNSKGYIFSADVIGPLGHTGNIAANNLDPVPLPRALVMFISGLLMLVTLAAIRRNRISTPNTI